MERREKRARGSRGGAGGAGEGGRGERVRGRCVGFAFGVVRGVGVIS